jgi:hypothetical protein
MTSAADTSISHPVEFDRFSLTRITMAYHPSRQDHQVRLSLNLPDERTDFNSGP